ncbi:MAG: UDP-N-acetylmuramoyl-L-alanyl-D-glutamate--2,6-diaminopimelate ligase [Methylophaga sp.]|nr:MAG: UDP-N-acetylmuramoyl-L-alanyl-D-glutamate--2,6-diaminopimelate ligase [Methylophaga sp.]
MNATSKHMNSLTALLEGLVADLSLIEDISVADISIDSRKVKKCSLFLSLVKDEKQRFQYLVQALNGGAAIVLFDAQQTLSSQEKLAIEKSKVKAYFIADLSDKAGEIAARFYDQPSQELTVMAVTGTNGKTSVSQFIAQSLESLGLACGIVGTLGVGRIGDLRLSGMTTPDPVSLQAVLADFHHQAIKYVVIEASSHALQQGRLNSVAIDVAVLTNLSRDHLDYHHSMSDYALAKQRLFEFTSVKIAVINNNDTFGKQLIETLATADIELITYGCEIDSITKQNTTLNAEDIQTTTQNISFIVDSKWGQANINSQLIGRFNVDNLLAAFGSLLAIGIAFNQAGKAIQECQSVDGRMQSYGGGQQPQVVVDFAHTPDALAQALQALRPHVLADGQLWCVFGCGGDRDQGKRPLMAASVEAYADQVVVTDDNPRSESSVAIVEDILAGFKLPEQVHIEHDRLLAITYAVTHATTLDIVLIAGKGHEQYQEISGVRHLYSDVEAVNIALQAANDEHHSFVGVK